MTNRYPARRPEPFRREFIDLDRLDKTERRHRLERAHGVFQHVFQKMDGAALTLDYTLGILSSPKSSKIEFYVDAQGLDVGVNFFGAFRIQLSNQKDICVGRFLQGFLPGRSGHGVTYMFAFRSAVDMWVRNLDTPCYLLDICSHPSSYVVAARSLYGLYPKHSYINDPSMTDFLVRFAEHWGREHRTDNDTGAVCVRVEIKLKDGYFTPAPRSLTKHAVFFHRVVQTDEVRPEALMFVFPINVTAAFFTTFRVAAQHVRSMARNFLGRFSE